MCSTEGAALVGRGDSPPPPSWVTTMVGDPHGFHGNQVAHPIRIEPDTKPIGMTNEIRCKKHIRYNRMCYKNLMV